MVKIERLFQNKKQKALWLVFVVMILTKLFSLPTPTPKECEMFYLSGYSKFLSDASCTYQLIPYWSTHFGGYLIYFVFMGTIFAIVASLLRNKK